MCESPATFVTFIRLLPTVDLQVLAKVGFAAEGLLALHTLIRLLPTMKHLMLKKVCALAEGHTQYTHTASLQSDSSHVEQAGASF